MDELLSTTRDAVGGGPGGAGPHQALLPGTCARVSLCVAGANATFVVCVCAGPSTGLTAPTTYTNAHPCSAWQALAPRSPRPLSEFYPGAHPEALDLLSRMLRCVRACMDGMAWHGTA